MRRSLSSHSTAQPLVQGFRALQADPDTLSVEDDVLDDDDYDDDEIDLDAYEAYLDEIQRKTEQRSSQRTREMRPYPMEAPQFYMVTANNPALPVDQDELQIPLPSTATSRPSTRPTRPMSARPRLDGGSKASSDMKAQLPRAPQTARPASSSAGVRRKRQEDAVSARIRAVYSDVGRRSSSSSAPSASATSSVTASSVLQSRLRIFQQAELHDEYYKLVDVVTDLRAVVQHEQAKRLKAIARVRRLEEIVAMKDKKIESMLQSTGVAMTLGQDVSTASYLQRELAHKERQHHVLTSKLRHRLAQQSQLIVAYEDAMQRLRASVKSTTLMELEEERAQLEMERQHLQEVIASQQMEMSRLGQQLQDLNGREAQWDRHVAEIQRDKQRTTLEKRKLEQDMSFLRAQVDQLQHQLSLEQRKRTYDHEVASSPRWNHQPSIRLSDSTSTLAETLVAIKSVAKPAVKTVGSSPKVMKTDHNVVSSKKSSARETSAKDGAEMVAPAPILTQTEVEEKQADENSVRQVRWQDDEKKMSPTEAKTISVNETNESEEPSPPHSMDSANEVTREELSTRAPDEDVTEREATKVDEKPVDEQGAEHETPVNELREKDPAQSCSSELEGSSTNSSYSSSTESDSSLTESSSNSNSSSASCSNSSSSASLSASEIDAAAVAMTQELRALGLLENGRRTTSEWSLPDATDGEEQEHDVDAELEDDTFMYELDFTAS
ncbi:hypothetical protein Poli38472_006726 [Pythium oligandrum]|uniref:Uncharacterized protein n=1 Tax=Pythium oligandrum TaxID=41045 RepID=A0A8K1FC23_PYTOL|nr:hypothetical protein Poli38472_006726 [Pythium oligandrum]|eukprot:TMW56716.1 hypothetical protein Poli38472_006726 [Pythium oligandrum]